MEIQQTEPNAESSEVVGSSPRPAPGIEKRERSRIAFPYGDLDDAVEVARVLRDGYGNQCAPDQLAAALHHDSPSSGAFRTKIATARVFGAVEVGRGVITLTDLGAKLADVQHEDEARAQAFLNVELYDRLYHEFRGQRLPSDKGLEFQIGRFGVSSKQLNKARIAFQRSAEQAGFFAHGKDRLVVPTLAARGATVPAEPPREPERWHAQNDDPMPLEGLHPLLVGLIKTIPREGEKFSPRRQKQWLEAARVNFALIFGGDDDEEGSEESAVRVGYAQRATDH